MDLNTQYQELCQKNGFYNNSAQLDVIRDLEHFGNLIMNLQTKKIKHGFFTNITNIIGRFLPSIPEAFPLGVYIHGDVGRGKSMLMDLFYKNIPIMILTLVNFIIIVAFFFNTSKLGRGLGLHTINNYESGICLVIIASSMIINFMVTYIIKKLFDDE